MDPLVLVIGITLGTAVFTFFLSLRKERGAADIMANRLEGFKLEGTQAGPSSQPTLLRKRDYGGLPVLNILFPRPEQTALELERAAIPLRPIEFYLIRLGMAFGLFLLPFLFNRGISGFVLAVGLAIAGFFLPSMYVSAKKKSRIKKINSQLVEMLGMVSNSLKSGYGLMQGFEFVTNQIGPPLALELRRMLRDVSLGMSGEAALNAFGERINSADLNMVITAINIQRAVGGNLAEILDNVAFTMRERERIRGEIATLTAQQRLSAIIIGALPIFVGALFFLIAPDYMSLLFTETVGQVMLLVGIGLEVLGIIALRRLVAIEV